MEYSDFEILKVVHTSRFFFNSEEQFEDENFGIGEAWENIKNNKNDATYLNRLISSYSSTIFQHMADMPLREFVLSYINDCKLYNDKNFWMGLSKKQRLKFCIHLLVHALWPEYIPISNNQSNSFGLTTKDYMYLCESFYPNGFSHKFRTDPFIMALLLFDIIKPISVDSLETSRRKQYNVEKERNALNHMIEFLIILKNNLPSHLPRILKSDIITDIENICDNYHRIISTITAPGETGIAHWLQIYKLGRISLSNSEPIIDNLSGVWRDNKNHFWIFLNTNHAAIRFKYGFPLKEARVYRIEQYITKTMDSSITRWTFYDCSIIIHKALSIGKLDNDDETYKATLSVKGISDYDGKVVQFDFRKMGNSIPSWCDWISFSRPSVSEATLFRESLLKTSKETKLSNLGEDISNPDYWLDTLLGIDNEYVYIFDQCYLAEPTIEYDEQERYSLKFYFKEYERRNIFSADISAEKPLYIIPRHPSCKCINNDIKDAIEQINWGVSVHIHHNAPDRIPRLYIPNFQVSIPLDEVTMNKIGIRKVTDSSTFFTI